MKGHRRILALIAALCICAGTIALLPSCTQPQSAVTFNTLYSVEKSTLAAYDSYVGLVIDGKVGTNDLPTISRAFNNFQVAMQAAADLANHNTNALAPQSVLDAAAKVTTAIAQTKGK